MMNDLRKIIKDIENHKFNLCDDRDAFTNDDYLYYEKIIMDVAKESLKKNPRPFSDIHSQIKNTMTTEEKLEKIEQLMKEYKVLNIPILFREDFDKHNSPPPVYTILGKGLSLDVIIHRLETGLETRREINEYITVKEMWERINKDETDKFGALMWFINSLILTVNNKHDLTLSRFHIIWDQKRDELFKKYGISV